MAGVQLGVEFGPNVGQSKVLFVPLISTAATDEPAAMSASAPRREATRREAVPHVRKAKVASYRREYAEPSEWLTG